MDDGVTPLRWGIMSTAKIGIEHVIPGIQGAQHGEVAAIASRNIDHAQSVASDLTISTAYGSYDALLEDDTLDAIYVPLPNHLHVPWSIKVLAAGKHLLCEKPIGVDLVDARDLAAAASQRPNLVAMEAFMYRFHPQWITAKSLVDNGAIGELSHVSTVFSYFNDDPTNIRNMPEYGGGALLDIGCYPVSQSRWLFGRQPERVLATMRRDDRFGTDARTSAVLDYGHGTATFTVSMQAFGYDRTQIVGTEGRIEIAAPVTANWGGETSITLQHPAETKTISFEPTSQYGLMADAVARSVSHGEPAPTPLSDALKNMSVLDALETSADRSAWVVPDTVE